MKRNMEQQPSKGHSSILWRMVSYSRAHQGSWQESRTNHHKTILQKGKHRCKTSYNPNSYKQFSMGANICQPKNRRSSESERKGLFSDQTVTKPAKEEVRPRTGPDRHL